MKYFQEEIAFYFVHVCMSTHVCEHKCTCVHIYAHILGMGYLCTHVEKGEGLGCAKCIYHCLSSMKQTTMAESYFSVLSLILNPLHFHELLSTSRRKTVPG